MMPVFTLDQLNTFIVHAKAKTYIGSGEESPSCRPASRDLKYTEGDFTYLDSYFGGADFIGEEVVYFQGQPVWGENYYGRLLEPGLISAEGVGLILKESLSRMYLEGRFLGGFSYQAGTGLYTDTNSGSLTAFTGKEWIIIDQIKVYGLDYHGGLIH
jgi:hypothetical protein